MLYMDVAYVHKSRKSVYHAYTPDLSAAFRARKPPLQPSSAGLS